MNDDTVKLAAEGDTTAWGTIWKHEEPKLRALLGRHVASRDVEEVLAKVAERMLGKRVSWPQEAKHFGGFLGRVAHFVAMEHRRELGLEQKFGAQAPAVQDAEGEGDVDLVTVLMEPGHGVTRTVEMNETVQRLHDAIPRTSDPVRKYLETSLEVGAGRGSDAEVARRLGLRPDEVFRLRKQAQSELRALMGGASRNRIPGMTSRPEERGPRPHRGGER